MSNRINTPLDNMIEQNLAAYIEANSSAVPTDFKVARELGIARLSLEEHAQIHRIAITALKAALANLKLDDPNSLTSLITLTNHAEERGHRLAQSCKMVAGIAKTGAEIENLLSTKLDATQIYSILCQLPSLLTSLLSSVLFQFFNSRNLSIHNGKPLSLSEILPELIAVISNTFNEEVERSVSVLTYSPTSNASNSNDGKGNGRGVIESQVVAMLNSVPTAKTTIVPADSEIAKTLRNLEDNT